MPDRQHVLRIDRHVVEGHGAARRGALAERTPVVDDGEARRLAWHPDLHGASFVVDRARQDAVREQCAGRVEALAVQTQAVRRGAQTGRALQDRRGRGRATLRAGIAEPLARQHFAIQSLFLRRSADFAQHAQHAEMVLRNLPQRRIGRAEIHEDFGERRERHAGAAVIARQGDRAKTTLRP